MRDAEKDRLALSVADRHSEFEEALAGNRRKYPTREFQLLAEAVRRYVEKDRKRRDDAPQRCQCRSRARRLSPGRTKAGSQRSARRGRKDWNASSFSATIRTSTGRASWYLRMPVRCLPKPRFRVCHLELMVGTGCHPQESCLVAFCRSPVNRPDSGSVQGTTATDWHLRFIRLEEPKPKNRVACRLNADLN